MSTRTYERTIPSSFVRQDDRTTSADQFLNVHDLQLARKNFNILLARRIRTPVLTMHLNANDLAAGDVVLSTFNSAPLSPQAGHIMGPWPIWVPPMCQTMEMRIRAHCSVTTGSVLLYPVIAAPGQTWPPGDDTKIEVSGTTETEYSVTINVPGMAEHLRTGEVRIYIENEIDDPSTADAETVIAAGIGNSLSGGSWVETVNQLTSGDIIGFSDASIEPRLIREEVAVSGGYRYYVVGTWNKVPTNGDTARTYTISKLHGLSLCLMADPVTSFGSFSVSGS